MSKRVVGSLLGLGLLAGMAPTLALPASAAPNAAVTGLTLVSVSTAGAAPGGAPGTTPASISADGRYVAFATTAVLAPTDAGTNTDAYLRDVTGKTTAHASTAHPGVATSANVRGPLTTSKGREVLWASDQNAWVNDPSAPAAQLYLADRVSSTTSRMSVNQAGTPIATSDQYDVSADGRFVLFTTTSSGFGFTDTNGTADLYQFDRMDGGYERLSVGLGGAQPNAAITAFDLSPDGRYAVLATTASNLVAGDTSGTPDLFRWDRSTSALTRLTDGTGTIEATVASNGTVCFTSSSSSLVPGGSNGLNQVVTQDVAGTRVLVSRATGGAAGNGASGGCSLSADGRFAVFQSSATDLIDGDANGSADVFSRDTSTQTTTRLAEDARLPAISASGRYAVFETTARLAAGDANNGTDVYRVDVPGAPTNTRPIAVVDQVTDDQIYLPDSLLPSVLANDVDPEGNPMTAELVSPPVDGELTFNSNGRFRYSPDEKEFGRRTFTYRAKDASGAGPVTTVVMTSTGDMVAGPCCPSLDIFRRNGTPRAVVYNGIAGVRPARLRIQVWPINGTGAVRTVELDTDDGHPDLELPGVTTDRVYKLRMGEITAEGIAWSDWEGEQISGYRSASMVATYTHVATGQTALFNNSLPQAWKDKMVAGTLPSTLIDDLLQRSTWNKKLPPVTRLFRAYFLRLPDTGGLDYWSTKYEKGTRLNTISQTFATSSEFKNRYGTLSNAQFVDRVYQNVFGRPPDSGGRSYWLKKLNAGTSRGAMMVGFSESSEYKNKTVGVTQAVLAYRALLGRAPRTSDKASIDQMQAGAPRTLVIGSIMTTVEFEDYLP